MHESEDPTAPESGEKHRFSSRVDPTELAGSPEAAESFHFTPEMDLKIDLFAEGLQLTDAARKAIQAASEHQLTTGDYVTTEGLMLKAGDIYINSPFPDANDFARNSPYVLDVDDSGNLFVTSHDGRRIAVDYIPPPAYMEELNAQGRRYGDMIATHGDRARLSPIRGCSLDCKFCGIRKLAYETIPAEELVDAVRKATTAPGREARHLLISGGTPGPKHYDYLNDVYARVSAEFPDLEIDIMMTPSEYRDKKLLDPQKLKDMGIHALSVNVELNDESEEAQDILGRKASIGKAAYLEFLKEAVEIFRDKETGEVGRVRSIVIVGLQPIEETLKIVEELASIGVSVELSPLRLDSSTPLQDIPPPSAEDQKRVYLEAHKIIDKYKEQYPGINDGLQCVNCMHNVLVFPR